jgi:AcrR family transcriptional regulator
MPRPDLSDERRRDFTPVLAAVFAEFGYRRTTTAELARRCEVQETILYRLWHDKRAMFIAALEFVYRLSEQTWQELLTDADPAASPAELIVEYEATHHGEFGLYRLVFAGLSETDDPDIVAALQRLYGHFQDFLQEQVGVHRGSSPTTGLPDPALTAWAMVGLGTVANIGRELDLIDDQERRRLIREMGLWLIGSR